MLDAGAAMRAHDNRVTTMQCPTCNSMVFSPTRYGSIPGGRRVSGVARCLVCGRIVAQKAGR
jgi:ribosomal protein S27E